MERSKIKVHFSFYIFLFLIIYFNNFLSFLSYFLALFLHEYSHYLLSQKYNKMSHTINIYPFGMDLSVNIVNKNTFVNFCIFLIGPMINIIVGLIIMSSWWHFPELYFYTKNFVYANFYLGFFNMIPIYPLDGGNMVLQLFSNFSQKRKTLKIMKVLAIILSIFFCTVFLISCFYSINFSSICIASFLISSIFSYDKVLNDEIKTVMCNNDNVKEYVASGPAATASSATPSLPRAKPLNTCPSTCPRPAAYLSSPNPKLPPSTWSTALRAPASGP